MAYRVLYEKWMQRAVSNLIQYIYDLEPKQIQHIFQKADVPYFDTHLTGFTSETKHVTKKARIWALCKETNSYQLEFFVDTAYHDDCIFYTQKSDPKDPVIRSQYFL